MKRILILDDEGPVREMIRRILEKEGYECSKASDAAEARALLKIEKFHLILCDIIMPNESGLDFIHYTFAEYPDTAVVMVTAVDNPETVSKTMDIGVYGYLVKPFQNNQLLITVANALKRLDLEKEKKYYTANLSTLVLDRTAELRKSVRELETAKHKLQKSEEKFRSIFENIHGAYYRVNMEFHIIMANPAAIRMLGCTSFDEIKGTDVIKYFVDLPQRNIILDELVRKEYISDFEAILRRKDGRFITVLIGSHFLFDADGKPWAIEGTLVDITDRKALEVQLTNARKLEAVGQLAAGIAHEINTPIQYVGDNTRFFKDAFNDVDTFFKKYEKLSETLMQGMAVKKFIKEVNSAIEETDMDYLREELPQAIGQTLEGVERVAAIVRSMKEFSHPGVKEKTAVDINRALENTIKISRNEWKYVAEMETNLDSSLSPVLCLPGELNQAFLNMIINAAQAIGDVVDDGSGEKGVIRVSTCKDGDYAEIRISDTGPGIPEKIQTRIFDPFFTTKEVGKGTGQGLAISRSVIVEKHGGDLSFSTEAGKGTTFFIRLPI